MKVLHICSDYPNTKLYSNLVTKLAQKNVEQIVFIPTATEKLKKIKPLKNVEFIFSSKINKFERISYFGKVNKMVQNIKDSIDLNNVDIVHAHFLFSNGGAAYRLKKEKNIEYIVAVRNTDVNIFLKYGLHLRRFGVEILKEAKNIVFLSESYKAQVLDKYVPKSLRAELEKKIEIIPNGIDAEWLENMNYKKKYLYKKQEIKLIFVGEIKKNKNLHNLIDAVQILTKRGYNVALTVIGEGSGKYEEKVKKKVCIENGKITFKGYISDKKSLIENYRNSDIFVMPSFKETFGLVYIEALTQGLPVIYSEGQGIHGYHEEGEIGFSVNPYNSIDIATKIEKVIENYEVISSKTLEAAKRFNWTDISEIYKNLYIEKLGGSQWK